ncbi:hypothetical protein AMQ68_13040 [Chryseobacterium sp. ERMR1:04]|nr:hypothetical protein AMQ68_13040 [Chryseobacterium sp. ERMR1:04]
MAADVERKEVPPNVRRDIWNIPRKSPQLYSAISGNVAGKIDEWCCSDFGVQRCSRTRGGGIFVPTAIWRFVKLLWVVRENL